MTDEPREKRPIERLELDRLRDVQKAIDEIQGHPRFPEGKAAWDEDKYYRGYCERQLEIVGEAASKLAADHEYEKIDPETPWKLIKGLRNVLAHVYWRTNKEILWKIIDEHVPELKGKVDQWIEERERALKDKPEPEKSEKKEGKLARKIRELTEKERPKSEDNPRPKP
jgi:uncharacterized protein with HEPN domain